MILLCLQLHVPLVCIVDLCITPVVFTSVFILFRYFTLYKYIFFCFNLECVSLVKEKLVSSIEKGKDNVAAFAHYVAMYIVFGKAVSNTKSNLNDAQSYY